MQTELEVMPMNKDYKFSLYFVYVFVFVYVRVSFWGKGVWERGFQSGNEGSSRCFKLSKGLVQKKVLEMLSRNLTSRACVFATLAAMGMLSQISLGPLLSRVSQLEWVSQALCRDEWLSFAKALSSPSSREGVIKHKCWCVLLLPEYPINQ